VAREIAEFADVAEVPQAYRSTFRLGSDSRFAVQQITRFVGSFVREIVDLLAAYGGPGSQAVSRSFSWIANPQLRQIVERDYRELSHFLFPSGAWKSTVVLAGSILEAVLYDRLTRDSARTNQAMAASRAPGKPPKGSGVKKDIKVNEGEDEWKLINLIQVAVEINLLPQEKEKVVDQVLRDYRNYIHPHKEYLNQQPMTDAVALLAKGALDDICNYFEMNP
jgi:hypothetical protein